MNTKRILVVDDEELNREYLSHLLSAHYAVTTVDSGEQAIRVAGEDPPSLVLLDIKMPGMDGYETCQRLKEDERTQACPVIFVSSNDHEEEILRGYTVGAADYFIRPFKPDELQIKVRQNIEIDESRKALSQQLEEANRTAFQALTDTSAYGAINLFLLGALKCASFPALAEKLFETTTAWGLQCVLQIRTETHTGNHSDSGQVSQIEERVLSATMDRGRIHDFGCRTVFSDRHCSLLVKNMPLDDEVRYGNYKDYIARLIEGVEGRVIALINEQQVKQRTTQLRKLLDFILQTFRHIQQQNQTIRVGSASIVEQMLEDLGLTIDEIGAANELSEDSESKVLAVGEVCLEQTSQLFSRGLKFNEQVEAMINLFEQTLGGKELTDSGLETLISSLTIPSVAD